MQKLSYRTQVLMKIFEFQTEHGRGILFNELLETTGLDREIVSKCFDSLWDKHWIEDKMDTIDGMHSKVIFIPEEVMPFVKEILDDITEGR